MNLNKLTKYTLFIFFIMFSFLQHVDAEEKTSPPKDISPRYNKAIWKNPQNPYVYYSRARAYLKINSNEKALDDINTSIRLSSGCYSFYIVRAATFERLKRYDESIADFQTATTLNKAAFRNTMNYQEIADLYMKKGDETQVNEYLKKSAELGNLSAARTLTKKDIPHTFKWKPIHLPFLPLEELVFPRTSQTIGISVSALFDTDYGVTGLQVNSLFSLTPEIIGVQIAAFPSALKLNGVQIGIGNNTFQYLNRNSCVNGIQLGVLWNIGYYTKGLQFSYVNTAVKLKGVQIGGGNLIINEEYTDIKAAGSGIQIGAYNKIEGNFTGAQIGVYNYCESLKGLQIGVINIINNLNNARAIPIINMAWE